MTQSDSRTCRIGIVGGAGYTAGELIRLLLNHPYAQIVWVASESNAGAPLSDVHSGLLGDTDMKFSSETPLDNIDLLFMCSAHGRSGEFWATHQRPDGLKVVDLAQDYRDESNGYVYGLTAINAHRAAEAMSVANPGCFATAIELSLLPAAAAGLLAGTDIHITGMTGSTGAGVKPGSTTHYSWRADNVSVYKPFTHQHLAEIGRTLAKVANHDIATPVFVPMRGPFQRGIFVTAVFDCGVDAQGIEAIYSNFYQSDPFVSVSSRPIDLKQVTGTNKAVIHIDCHDGHVLVTCAIDNLLKGASGQAVENMNLMMGYDRTAGLRLKATAF